MTAEDEVRDDAVELREPLAQRAPAEPAAQDADDDEDVDAHVWRAQT